MSGPNIHFDNTFHNINSGPANVTCCTDPKIVAFKIVLFYELRKSCFSLFNRQRTYSSVYMDCNDSLKNVRGTIAKQIKSLRSYSQMPETNRDNMSYYIDLIVKTDTNLFSWRSIKCQRGSESIQTPWSTWTNAEVLVEDYTAYLEREGRLVLPLVDQYNHFEFNDPVRILTRKKHLAFLG